MTKKRMADLAFTLLLLVIIVYVVVAAQEWPRGAQLFPTMIGSVMGALLLAQIVTIGIRARRTGGAAQDKPLWPGVDPALARRRAIATTATVIGVAVSVWLFGFPIGGPLALAVHLFFVVRESWLVSTLMTAGSIAFLWAMSVLLRIPFAEPALPFLSNPF